MKYLFTIFFLIISYCSYSQIEINKIEKPELIGEIRYGFSFSASIQKYKTFYVFMYRNDAYIHISDINSFFIKNEDFDSFKELFLDENIDEKAGQKFEVTLMDNNKLIIEYYKPRRKTMVRYFHIDENGKTALLPTYKKRELKKLFGLE